MASFVGTNDEFRRYIGPRLRNLVQQFTRRHRREVAACEYCGETNNLESAHIKGRDRNRIIDLIIEKYTVNGIITIDLSVLEAKFKEEHEPIEKSILILCHDCHREYDSIRSESEINEHDSCTVSENATIRVNEYLPITLEPSDPVVFKQELLVSKRAEIETIYSDGRVEQKLWNASRFNANSNVFGNLRSRQEYRSGNWQNNGIVKVNVRIIKNA